MTTSRKRQMEILKMLDLQIANTKKLSNVMNDYQHGVEVQQTDLRSTFDKLNDKNFMENEFRKKVYKLFSNDTTQSEGFLKKFENSNMDIGEFNIVHKQLVQLFQGTLAPYATVYSNMVQLIDNLQQTGNPAQAVRKAQVKSDEDMARDMSNGFEDEDLLAAQRRARESRKEKKRREEIEENADIVNGYFREDNVNDDSSRSKEEWVQKHRENAIDSLLQEEYLRYYKDSPKGRSEGLILTRMRQNMLEEYAEQQGFTMTHARAEKRHVIKELEEHIQKEFPKLGAKTVNKDANKEYDRMMIAALRADDIDEAFEESIQNSHDNEEMDRLKKLRRNRKKK
jgi:hypothetical protein